VKSLLAEYQGRGLRMIEVGRAYLIDLPEIQGLIRNCPERFIVFCDDLAFESDDAGYKVLKATLEGTLSEQPDNLLIYATSNRRHLLPEFPEDNQSARWIDGELHQGEAVEEKISLSERFGVWLSFHAFNQDQYLEIVEHWLDHYGYAEDSHAARTEALAYALLRGSRSGRVAFQFAKSWAGRNEKFSSPAPCPMPTALFTWVISSNTFRRTSGCGSRRCGDMSVVMFAPTIPTAHPSCCEQKRKAFRRRP